MQDKGEAPQGGAPKGIVRLLIAALILSILVSGLVILALIDPFGFKPNEYSVPTTVSASPSPTRAAYQFAPVSDEPLPGAQQCPDAGSVGAARADAKTEVVTVKGERSEPIELLGPNRRVVIAAGATMTGWVTICGDGGTVLIIGSMQGSALLRGSGVKIVVQDGGRLQLPPQYFTTNGTVFRCTTERADATTPHCDDYLPRPGAKPNG